MANPSHKPASEVSTQQLKSIAKLLKAVILIAGGLVLANIGYFIYHLVQNSGSLEKGGLNSTAPMAGLAASLFFASAALKNIQAQLKARE